MAMTKSYDLKGIMDDFAGFITNQSPSETPFYSALKTDGTPRPRYQWIVDAMDGADGVADATGGAEGTAAPAANPEAAETGKESTLMGYTQIFRKFISLSQTAADLSYNGRSNALAYAIAKATKNIKLRAENAFLQNGQAVAENGQGTAASKTGGVKSQINTSRIKTGLTLDNFTALFKSLENNQSNADTILVHPSTYPTIVHIFAVENAAMPRLQWMGKDDEGNDKEYFTITSPYGRIYKVIATHAMPEDEAFIYADQYLSNVVFRAPKISLLSPTGSNVNYLVEMECGVRVDDPARVGYIEKAAVVAKPAASTSTGKGTGPTK